MATSTHATILLFLAAYAAVAWPLFSRWALWRDLAAVPDEWRGDERARQIPLRRAVASSLAASFVARRPPLHPPAAAEVVLHTGPSRGGHGGHRLLRHRRHEPLRPAPAERQGLPPGRRRRGSGGRRPAVPEDPARGAHAVPPAGSGRSPMAAGASSRCARGPVLPLRPPGSKAADPLHRLSFEIAPLGVRFLPYPVTAISGAASPELIRRYGVVPLVRDGDGNFHLTFEPPRLFRVEVLSGPRAGRSTSCRRQRRTLPGRHRDRRRSSHSAGTSRAVSTRRRARTDSRAGSEHHLATRFFYSRRFRALGTEPRRGVPDAAEVGALRDLCHGDGARPARARHPVAPRHRLRGRRARALRLLLPRPRPGRPRLGGGLVRTGVGWIAFDPTPPAGRPGVTKVNLIRSAGQLFENLEFLYGRYVLGFAQADQASLAQTVREGFEAVSETAKSLARALRAFGGVRDTSACLLLLGVAAAGGLPLLCRVSLAGGGLPDAWTPSGVGGVQEAPEGPASAGRRPDARLRAVGNARLGRPSSARAASPGRSSERTSRNRSGAARRRRPRRRGSTASSKSCGRAALPADGGTSGARRSYPIGERSRRRSHGPNPASRPSPCPRPSPYPASRPRSPSKVVEKTLVLAPDGRLVLDTYKGRVAITAWDRSEAAIRAVVTADGQLRRRAPTSSRGRSADRRGRTRGEGRVGLRRPAEDDASPSAATADPGPS